MKRHLIAMVSVCLFVSQVGYSEDPDVRECNIVEGFYKLWEKSFFGREPNRIEAAAWVVNGSPGRYEFVFWETTPEREKNTWRNGEIPAQTVAIAHTHPQKVDPKPSSHDVSLARRLNLPIYTISRKGIWKVPPAGTIQQEASPHWHKALESCED